MIRNSDKAWHKLFAEYNRQLQCVGAEYQLSREDTEDAAQTTWLKLIETSTDAAGREEVARLLKATMRRECLRRLAGESQMLGGVA
ncbi:hypothetical protein AB0L75_40515 [Streptomyces sp. NPDC052101]|uniref:hypothetical protein n=1 Tax=Streptomyces sp. NPDC052101 TaxID=3155763 RepID=UPI003435B5DC